MKRGMNNRVLSELCLDAADFDIFLESTYSSSLTVNQLYQGVALYTDKAMQYYFPGPRESGLTQEEWATAGYDCENLMTRFKFGG